MKQIYSALIKAQSQIKLAKIDATAKGAKFSYDYSTLGSVWDAVKEALAKNELAIIQTVEIMETGKFLKTRIIHVSGEFIDGLCPLAVDKNDMQGLGSAITYARRYSLAMMLGVVQDDDDGASSKGNVSRETSKKPEPPKPPKEEEKITAKEWKIILETCEGMGNSVDDLKQWLKEKYKITHWNQIKLKDFMAIVQKAGAEKSLKEDIPWPE